MSNLRVPPTAANTTYVQTELGDVAGPPVPVLLQQKYPFKI